MSNSHKPPTPFLSFLPCSLFFLRNDGFPTPRYNNPPPSLFFLLLWLPASFFFLSSIFLLVSFSSHLFFFFFSLSPSPLLAFNEEGVCLYASEEPRVRRHAPSMPYVFWETPRSVLASPRLEACLKGATFTPFKTLQSILSSTTLFSRVSCLYP